MGLNFVYICESWEQEKKTVFVICMIKLIFADPLLHYLTNNDILDIADELLEDDGYFEDEYFAEEAETSVSSILLVTLPFLNAMQIFILYVA